MSKSLDVLVLNPPSPPGSDVCRDWAGGFGTARPARRRAEYGHSSEPFLYPFLPYVCAVLSSENYEHTVLDCQRLRLNKVQVLAEVRKRSPDVVFSLISLPSLKGDLEILDAIKDALPDVVVVGVGTTCRVLHKSILSSSKIDAVLMSSYPYVSNVADLLNALESRQDLKKAPGISCMENGTIIETNEASDMSLDELLPPRYEELELNGYESFEDLEGSRYSYIPILGSKGCPYPCIYCPYPLGFGRKCMYRSPKSIVDEMEYLHARGVEGFLFRDQSFPMNQQHAIEVCEEIMNRKLDLAWFCESRVDQVSNELLCLMKKAGCKQVHFGVETGDPELIKSGKPQANLDMIRKAFRLTHRVELYTTAHVILGWPDESLESLAITYRFVKEISPDDVNWSTLTPYPGTRLREMAEQNNLILTDDWSEYTSHTVVMRTKYLDATELERAKNKIIRNYSRRRLIRLILHVGQRPRFVVNELKKTVKSYFM